MFVDIEDEYRNCSPDSALIMHIAEVVMQFFVFHVKGEDDPTTGSETKGREFSGPFFVGAKISFDEGFDVTVACRSVRGHVAEVGFVQCDTIQGKTFLELELAEITVGGISS